MTKLTERKCIMSGCKFLVQDDDPTLCKCAAVVHGLKPEPSDFEKQMDAMLNLPDFERGVLSVAIANLNARGI